MSSISRKYNMGRYVVDRYEFQRGGDGDIAINFIDDDQQDSKFLRNRCSFRITAVVLATITSTSVQYITHLVQARYLLDRARCIYQLYSW